MTKSDINILVVDDEQIVLDSVCRHLRKEACTVYTVMEVNQHVLADPNKALEDPYGDGWLVRLKPTRFDEEVALPGL